MKSFVFALLLSMFSLQTLHAFDHAHSDWNTVLQKYRAESGMFRYKKLKEDLGKSKNHLFQKYLKELSEVSHAQYLKWNKNEKMAFLINAYNAFTIRLILDHYPLESITDIGGWLWMANKKPWRMKFFSILDGKIQSLDPIEQDFLRSKEFEDYRIHAALNCASISCPVLRGDAYTAKDLDQQLEEQMYIWIQDPSRNNLDRTIPRISKVFDWYEVDFKKWGGGIQEVLLKYAPKEKSRTVKRAVSFQYLHYNWKLNEEK